MKTNLAYLILYCLYFLLLAVGWLVAPEAWQGAIFFVTYASATVAIVTLGYLIDRRQNHRNYRTEDYRTEDSHHTSS